MDLRLTVETSSQELVSQSLQNYTRLHREVILSGKFIHRIALSCSWPFLEVHNGSRFLLESFLPMNKELLRSSRIGVICIFLLVRIENDCNGRAKP
jgi:hypothetical protein